MKKQVPSFQPAQPVLLDTKNSIYGETWAKAVNELLQNAIFD
jgi:hypothetical protein